MMDKWLSGSGNEKLYPCWWSIVYIVADDIGGGNPAAAREIAKNWESMNVLTI